MGKTFLNISLSGVVFLLNVLFFNIDSARGTGEEELEGVIEPSEVIELSSQVPGIIDQVLVERGDRVEKGQVLVRLKSGVEKAAVELARARVAFGKRKVVRNEKLYQKQLISIHEKDEMETELKITEAQLKEAIEKLELRIIRSPIQGVVVERTLGPGEYIGEGSIMSIARIDPLYIEVIAPINWLGKIKKGMNAQVRAETTAGGVYKARVIIVDQVVDAASGTFGVRLELPNPSYSLPAGLRCRVRFMKE